MPIELKKEPVKINEVIGEDFSQTLVEGDIIVPDVKPDILRILQVDGTALVNSKEIQQDKIIVDGTVNFKILYVPDESQQEDLSGTGIKSIYANSSFSHEVALKGAQQNMIAQIESDIEHIDFKVLNGRKLNLKAVVSVDCKVTNTFELEMVTDIDGEEDVQVLRKNVKAFSSVAEDENEFVVREELEVPSGKPSIQDLLKMDVKITGKDVKLINNKVVVKGELNVCTLYAGDISEQPIQFMEHEIPFTEIFDVDGVREDMYCELDYAVQDVYFQVREDSDGDTRVVGIEATVNAHTKVSEWLALDVVADAYSPYADIAMETKTYKIDEMIDDQRAQTTLKEIIELPADIPDIVQVYNVITKPYISETKVETGKVVIEGVIDTYILYLADNTDNPIFSYKQEVPFKHSIDVNNVTPEMTCDVKVEVDHCSYNLNAGSEVEVRYTVATDLKVIRSTEVGLVTQAELTPVAEAQTAQRPSIVLYFVQKNDTLWKVAKQYRTTVQDIQAVNKLENADNISLGQQLLIPKIQQKCG